MPDVVNPIPIGFQWLGQDFVLAAGMLEAGDKLRAHVRPEPMSDTLFFEMTTQGGGLTITGNTVRVEMTEEQTRLISPPRRGEDERFVFLDFVRIPVAGDEMVMPFIIQLSAYLPVTRARA